MQALEDEGLRYCPLAEELLLGECADEEEGGETVFILQARKPGFGCPWEEIARFPDEDTALHASNDYTRDFPDREIQIISWPGGSVARRGRGDLASGGPDAYTQAAQELLARDKSGVERLSPHGQRLVEAILKYGDYESAASALVSAGQAGGVAFNASEYALARAAAPVGRYSIGRRPGGTSGDFEMAGAGGKLSEAIAMGRSFAEQSPNEDFEVVDNCSGDVVWASSGKKKAAGLPTGKGVPQPGAGSPAIGEVVLVRFRCGVQGNVDRDCLPDDRRVTWAAGTMDGIRAWLITSPRYVEIWSGDGVRLYQTVRKG